MTYRAALVWLCISAWTVSDHAWAAEPAWVRVSADQQRFVLEPSGEKFVPWGFNARRAIAATRAA